jgi:hypothetical protein
LNRCYFADYRFSEDMDFTLREALPFEAIRARLEPVYAIVQQQSGIVFTFDRQDPRVRANTHTFYLRYTGQDWAPKNRSRTESPKESWEK